MIRIIFHKNNLKQRNNTSKVFNGRKYSVSHGIRREGVRKEGRYGECAFGWSSKFIDRGNSDKTRPFPRAIHLWAVYDVRLSKQRPSFRDQWRPVFFGRAVAMKCKSEVAPVKRRERSLLHDGDRSEHPRTMAWSSGNEARQEMTRKQTPSWESTTQKYKCNARNRHVKRGKCSENEHPTELIWADRHRSFSVRKKTNWV